MHARDANIKGDSQVSTRPGLKLGEQLSGLNEETYSIVLSALRQSD